METLKKLYSVIVPTLITSFALGFAGGLLGSYISSSFFTDSHEMVVRETVEKRSIREDVSTIAAVEKVLPAVVDIVVTKDIALFSNRTGPDIFPFDDYFEFPFDIAPPSEDYDADGDGESPIQRQEVGGGSGFIISSDGLIVTNKHVIDEPDAEFIVILNDGTRFPAEALGRDPFNDLAIMKIDGQGLPTVVLGDSDAITIGQTVIAIGNSLGEYQNTVTKGVISGINRRVIAGSFGSTDVIEEAIQTDAAINPGNSGGPLINLDGEVIGVNTAISRAGQLIGFAIPVNTAKQVTESVLSFGRIVRPWLGVRYVMNNPTLAEENSYGVAYGALLVPGSLGESAVLPESPADKAGLLTDDIILTINGERLDEGNPLGKIIARFAPQDTVELLVLRGGAELTLTATLEEFKN